MRSNFDARAALVAAGVATMFAVGFSAASCATAPATKPAPAAVRIPVSPHLIVGYARKHPDPAVAGPFADKLSSGEIKIVIEKPREHAMASFGFRDGAYVLTVDPDRLKEEPTQEEFEDVLSILSHEHAHYRQYVEGEMTNYHSRGGKMSETQCTLTILVEIDAHAKTCRDVRANGWTSSAARHACESTPASIADFFLKERLGTHPECKPVWGHFSGTAPAPAKAERARAPVRTRSAESIPKKRSGPIYMPPP